MTNASIDRRHALKATALSPLLLGHAAPAWAKSLALPYPASLRWLAQLGSYSFQLSREFTRAGATWAGQMLEQGNELPSREPRMVYSRAKDRLSLNAAKWAALPEGERAEFKAEERNEEFYYSTHYGSPIAYAVALAAAQRTAPVASTLTGMRILDIGYGAIGAMQMLAYAGAHVSALDVDPLMTALYDQPEDQGSFKPAHGPAGSLKLFDGVFAGDAALTKNIGGGYQLILSKNTLKRGFMKPLPGRKAWVSFGVSDEVFLQNIHEALAPGGVLVVYNIAAAFNPERPSTDGRSPFSREQYEQAGLKVLALDQPDDAAIRRLGYQLRWDGAMGDLERNLFALFTVVQRAR